MRLVIADTGPINYLLLIGNIDLLPSLFKRVALPSAVQAELSKPRAPLLVKRWIANPPAWLEVHNTTGLPQVSGLDDGETAAIALAQFLHADIVLIDERKGVTVARNRGLRVTGTLGLLDMAANDGLINFVESVERLRRTTFRSPAGLIDAMVKRHLQKAGMSKASPIILPSAGAVVASARQAVVDAAARRVDKHHEVLVHHKTEEYLDAYIR